ncbi:MAG TPA: fructose-6-phosphate aldolase [Candidatus Thermoplasmatota archaeon]|nr:fructose-6-phosphate aldolase [Candidatus Thermoplasmatota archaeon]
MKIFLDTANVDEIRKAAAWGLVDGVTTNPTLIMKEGRDFKKTIEEIATIVDGPISAEVVSEKGEDMVQEALPLTKIHPNVIIKVPMTLEGMKAVKKLSSMGIKTNVTLIFSPTQALLAAKAGATYVSPFVGRLDDYSMDGMQLIEKIVTIFQNYGFDTQVLVASVRHPEHVVSSALMGAHVVTLPFKVLEQMAKHPQTDSGIAQFLKDWEKAVK